MSNPFSGGWPCPDCYLAESRGIVAHAHLEDNLFVAPGIWNFKDAQTDRAGLSGMVPASLEDFT